MKRNDLLTGEVFSPNRITQKFACTDNRITYHNRKANKLRHSIMYINSPLHKNLRILIEIMEGKEIGVFHRQFLLGKGYSFDVLTHFESVEGKQISCVYHFSMTIGENDNLIFKRLKNN